MFLGHIGVGLGTKSAFPRISLGTLLLASLFIDLLWPSLLLLGFEQVEIEPGNTLLTPLKFTEYPISHSLLGVLIWACLFGTLFFVLRRRLKEAVICGIVVLSHWFLDLLVHGPDLQLVPGISLRVGLGLWNSLPATLVAELSIFVIGTGLYCYRTKPVGRTGSIGFRIMILLLLVIFLGNTFGDPPPSPRAIAWFGQAQWLIVIWGYWIEKRRELRWLYN